MTASENDKTGMDGPAQDVDPPEPKDNTAPQQPPEETASSEAETAQSQEETHEFSELKQDTGSVSTKDINFILDIPLKISVELGQTTMLISELLKLGQGSVISLSKAAGEHLEILANQKLIAKGDVVVVDGKYGVRLTEIVSHTERIEKLR